MTLITTLSAIGYVIYFMITYIWMNFTFQYKRTLNYYIFKNELEREKKSFMHYVEAAVIIFLLIGLIITIISQIQIWSHRKVTND